MKIPNATTTSRGGGKAWLCSPLDQIHPTYQNESILASSGSEIIQYYFTMVPDNTFLFVLYLVSGGGSLNVLLTPNGKFNRSSIRSTYRGVQEGIKKKKRPKHYQTHCFRLHLPLFHIGHRSPASVTDYAWCQAKPWPRSARTEV
jgi:hypothetical protein